MPCPHGFSLVSSAANKYGLCSSSPPPQQAAADRPRAPSPALVAVAEALVSLCTITRNAMPWKRRRSSASAPALQDQDTGAGRKQLLATLGGKAAAVAKMVPWNRRSPPPSSSSNDDDEDLQAGAGGRKQLFATIGGKAAAVAKMVSWNRRSPPPSSSTNDDEEDLQARAGGRKQLLTTLGGKAAAVAKMVSSNRWSPPSSSSNDEEDLQAGAGVTAVDAEDEEALWKKTIIMGDKCRPLQFSGRIAFDADGYPLPEPEAAASKDAAAGAEA